MNHYIDFLAKKYFRRLQPGEFRELRNVLQKRGDNFRRWFESEGLELIVWYKNDKKTISGFQLCYTGYDGEHAFTWYADFGYHHDKVDNTKGWSNTPILVSNGPFPAATIIEQFKVRSGSLENKLSELIMSKLEEYDSSHSG